MQALFAFFFVILFIALIVLLMILIIGASFIVGFMRLILSPFRRNKKKGRVKKEHTEMMGTDGLPVIDVMVKDPVCGTYLPRQDAVSEIIRGNTLYFCSKKCLSEYKQQT
jgi:uncharacterized protein